MAVIFTHIIIALILPVISGPTSFAVDFGGSFSSTCDNDNHNRIGFLNMTWIDNNGDVVSMTTDQHVGLTLTLDNVNEFNEGVYQCRITVETFVNETRITTSNITVIVLCEFNV